MKIKVIIVQKNKFVLQKYCCEDKEELQSTSRLKSQDDFLNHICSETIARAWVDPDQEESTNNDIIKTSVKNRMKKTY